MSLEIANLVARLTVELDGVQQSVNEMRRFTEQARAAGDVTEQTAEKFDRMANATDRLAAAHRKEIAELAKVEQSFRKAGFTIDEARETVRKWEEDLARARALSAQGLNLPTDLIHTTGPIPENVRIATTLLATHDRQLNRVQRSSDQLGTSVGRLRGAFGGVVAEARRSQQPLRTMLRSLLSINNGSVLTASGLASVIGRLTGLGLVAAVAVRGIRALIRTFREGAAAVDAFTRADDNVASMVRNFEQLENVNLTALVGQLDDLSIRMKNLGAIDPVAATEQILTISADFQFLNATPDDLAKTIQEIQQTVATLDFSNLASFDLGEERVEDLNRKYQELASQGLTQAQLRTMVLVDLERIRAEQAGVAAKRQADEEGTLESVLARTGSAMKKGITDNEAFQASVDAVADALTLLEGPLRSIGNAFGEVLAFGVNAAIDVVEGFRAVWFGTLSGVARLWKEFVEIISFGQIDTSGIDEFISKQDALVQQIAVFDALRDDPLLRQADAAEKFGTGLVLLADRGALTIDVFEKLRRTTSATVADARDATKVVLSWAESNEYSAEQVALMERALADWEKQLESGESALTGFEASGVDAFTAVKNALDDVQGGAGVINVLRNLGEASKELTEFGDAQAAFKYFEAYEAAIETALNGGAQKLRAFRDFVEETLQPQLSTEGYNELIRGIEAAEEAFAGVEADAANFSEATVGANVTVADYGNSAATATEQTNGLNDAVVTTTANLNNMVAGGPYKVEVIYAMSELPAGAMAASRGTGPKQLGMTSAGGSPGDIMSRTPSPPPPPAKTPTTEGATAATRSNALLEDKVRTLEARQEAAASGNLNPNSETVFDIFNRARGGGGGGGSQLLDVEAIRAFMQEVNRAIAIASREGVRIGTAGNAIPFEPGSFLNAQGGGLSVDTILIRGVWDFADPAAKRQIIKELEEALQSLQAEV